MAAESNMNLDMQVTRIKAKMQDLVKEIQNIRDEGGTVVDVFKKVGDKIEGATKMADNWRAKIDEAKKEIEKYLETQEKSGKLDDETRKQQTQALKQLIRLADSLASQEKKITSEIVAQAKEEQRVRQLKQKGEEELFNAKEKAKSQNQEISAGEQEIARILREQAANAEAAAAKAQQEQELRDEIARRNKKRSDNVLAFEKRQQELRDRRAAREKEIAAEREADAKKQKKIADDLYKNEQQQAKEAIKRAFEEREARIKADIKKLQSSKLTVNRRRKLEEKYYNDLLALYPKDSKKYIEVEAQKTTALAKYEKQREQIVNKYRKSRPKEVEQTETESKGFLSDFRRGFGGSSMGKLLGRFVGITAVIQTFRKALQLARQAIVESFKAAVAYEAQLAQLQAVTGVSNAELDALSKSVLDVAGSTTFTSEEIVKLQTELGKLGFSSDQIVAATEGIARTAQALGEQVGPVAQKVGQILKQYNLDASETEKVSDILVSTINSSALSFEGLGTAIQYIGPLAAQAGTEFKDTAAAMAILADNGFTASRIGTGLRGILTELSKTGADLTSVIRDLSDQEISFSNAVDLVGKRNAAQLISLVENIDALEDATNKYYQLGSAAIASSQQIDTYRGNVQLLQSAFNKLQIEFGNSIKNSGLVRWALGLIDEEGRDAAESARALSQVNLTDFSASLGEAAESLIGMGAFTDEDLAIKAEDIIQKDVLDKLRKEVDDLIAERNRLFQDNSGGTFGNVTTLNFDRRDSPLNDDEIARVEAINDRVKEIGNLIGRGSEITLDNVKEAIMTTRDLLKDAVEQAKIDKERRDIQEEYSGLLKSERRFRDDNFNLQVKELKNKRDNAKTDKERLQAEEDLAELQESRIDTLAEGVDFNKRQEAEVLKIKERIAEEQANLVNLDGEEYVLAQARIEQLEQERTNFNNLVYNRDELFELAQKEYELEFKRLSNQINGEKELLKTKEDEIKLALETLENDLKRTTGAKERQEIIDKQIRLENELLKVQDRSRQTIDVYLNNVREKLEAQKKLWEEQGYDTRTLDKAFERLEQFQQVANEMKIDFPEFEEGAKRLAKSLDKRFGKKLKKGISLSDKDKEEIQKDLEAFFSQFGDNLSDSQKKLLEDFIMSSLGADSKVIKDQIKKLILDIFGKVADAAKQYNDVALENTRNRLRTELDEIRNRYATEEEILKAQLNNQLITESQFRAKSAELKKRQLQEENEVNRKIFESEKKSDLINVSVDTAEALASNIVENYSSADAATASIYTILGTAAIVAAGAAKADAIRRRKFFPAKFEQGGFVNGPSHSEGGVPFTVQGQGGYEMEGGEFIVNKRAAAFHRSLLERINNSYKPQMVTEPLRFAQGGLIEAQRATQINVNAQSEESVNYLKAIAHATISTATDMKKPTRAFITSKDLSNNETERRLRERNDRI